MLGVGYLLSMNQRDESTIVEVDGKSLRLTHLSKVMFPDDGFAPVRSAYCRFAARPAKLGDCHTTKCSVFR